MFGPLGGKRNLLFTEETAWVMGSVCSHVGADTDVQEQLEAPVRIKGGVLNKRAEEKGRIRGFTCEKKNKTSGGWEGGLSACRGAA